jgi:hypothetical protein
LAVPSSNRPEYQEKELEETPPNLIAQAPSEEGSACMALDDSKELADEYPNQADLGDPNQCETTQRNKSSAQPPKWA